LSGSLLVTMRSFPPWRMPKVLVYFALILDAGRVLKFFDPVEMCFYDI
jgi:hypothetical protein